MQVPATPFIYDYANALTERVGESSRSCTRATQIAARQIGATSYEFDFYLGDPTKSGSTLLPTERLADGQLRYFFRAKVEILASAVFSDEVVDVMVIDRAQPGLEIPVAGLVHDGSEIAQLDMMRDAVNQFETNSRTFAGRVIEHPTIDRRLSLVRRDEVVVVNKRHQVVSRDVWVLQTFVQVLAQSGSTRVPMDYCIETPISMPVGGRAAAAVSPGSATYICALDYAEVQTTPEQRLASLRPIQIEETYKEGSNTVTKQFDRPFRILSALNYFREIGAYFDDMARHSVRIAGAVVHPSFTPSTSSSLFDPLDGHAVALPCEHLGRATTQLLLEDMKYDPASSVGGKGMFTVGEFTFDPAQGPLVPSDKNADYAVFAGFAEMADFVKEADRLAKACGGLRPVGGGGSPATTGPGITFHAIDFNQPEGHLEFTAETHVASGVATLVDAATGLPIAGSDASSLAILVGDEAAGKRASMAMRTGYVDAYGHKSTCGAVSVYAWKQDAKTGSWALGVRRAHAGMRLGNILEMVEHQLKNGDVLADALGIHFEYGEGYRPVVAFRQVLPGFDVPAAAGGTGIRVAGEVLLDVGRSLFITSRGRVVEPGEWQLHGLAFLNVNPQPGVADAPFHNPIDAGRQPRVLSADSILVPIQRAIAGLNVAGAVVRRIEAGTGSAQDVYRNGYITLKVTYDIGGALVARIVQVQFTQDPGTKSWHVGGLWWGVDSNNLHRIDWPGIYHGVEADKPGTVSANRDYPETLVGLFQVEDGSMQWLQFTCAGHDITSAFDAMPSAGSPGLYGWLEAVGPAGVGRVPITDPRHPYTLAQKYHDGEISLQEYEAGLLRVFGWFLEFMAACPRQDGSVVNGNARPVGFTVSLYPQVEPSWAHVFA